MSIKSVLTAGLSVRIYFIFEEKGGAGWNYRNSLPLLGPQMFGFS